MAQNSPEYGTFQNGIPYARYGGGEKDLVLFYGGPGNNLPTGVGAGMVIGGFQPLLDRYTMHLVSRKSGLPQGYTTRDMSDDYAQMIRQEFGGHVDLVVGMSFGGMIAQHFAADHADLFDHLVIAMAAHRASEAGNRVDTHYAALLSLGRRGRAMATMAEALFPHGLLKPLAAGLFWLLGGFVLGPQSDTFKKDVLIEAQAEVDHDATESLERIEVPVLALCGDRDFYFPLDHVREMVDRIEDATLKVYEGKGHNLTMDKRIAGDILDFVEGRE